MKTIDIKQKLEEIDVTAESIVLGDFDLIGEHTAKKQRSNTELNYKRYGAFFRPNYERGILIYYLIRKFKLESMLEIGFGRGYAALCATKAFDDAGIDGLVTSIDPNVNQQFMLQLQQIYPAQWFQRLKLINAKSQDALATSTEKYDLIYIDGDHSENGVRTDWTLTRDKFNRFLLFDDYHMPSKDDPGIQCRKVIDEIEGFNKELILMDRLMFIDDRYPREELNYGQVLITK